MALTNKQRWENIHIPTEKGPLFKAVADRLMLHRPRYEAVSKALKAKGFDIPWEFIAVTHQREASGNFNTYLGNGQALNRKTTIVPKGRGPFSSWEEGAIDALLYAPPYAAKNKDWSVGGMLDKLEEYNGLGYRSKGVPSPYLWAGTDQYVKGKYVRDHVYDPNHVDTQLGCAGLLKFLGWGKKTSVPVSGTLGGVVVGGGAIAAASATTTFGQFVATHWVSLLIGAVALGIVIDFLVTLYKNRNNTNAE
jgi:lysozyme family protein